MRIQFVADNHTIINIQGIRYVEKIDGSGFGSSETEYRIHVTYKGDQLRYSYPSKETRDAQYNRLREAMLGVNKK